MSYNYSYPDYSQTGCLECGIRCNPSSQLCRSCITRNHRFKRVIRKKQEIPSHFANLLLQIKEQDRECSICGDIIKNNMYITPCFHLFHLTCVNEQKTCPICRNKI